MNWVGEVHFSCPFLGASLCLDLANLLSRETYLDLFLANDRLVVHVGEGQNCLRYCFEGDQIHVLVAALVNVFDGLNGAVFTALRQQRLFKLFPLPLLELDV